MDKLPNTEKRICDRCQTDTFCYKVIDKDDYLCRLCWVRWIAKSIDDIDRQHLEALKRVKMLRMTRGFLMATLRLLGDREEGEVVKICANCFLWSKCEHREQHQDEEPTTCQEWEDEIFYNMEE